MPSKDTISWRLTKETRKAIERWRKKISETLDMDIDKVTYKSGEIALRISSERGNVKITELRDIMLGKIK